ncbi:MAG: nascent polypeptide-associated complex protein [Thermoplasmata archaeon]
MIPGGRIHPRQMKQMMKKLGIESEEIEGVEEVIIKTSSKEYHFTDAEVTMTTLQGQKTFQIVGEPEITEKEEELKIPIEDIKLVAEKANVSEKEARKALEECDGEPAEAIIKLMSG